MQKQVNTALASGLCGMRAAQGAFIYHSHTFLAEDGVVIGRFVWPSPENPQGVKGASLSPTVPLGLIERAVVYVEGLVGSEDEIPAGALVTVVRQGSFWAKTKNEAQVGQKIFASLADGTMVAGGAGETVSGHVETPWTVDQNAQAGEILVISA
ncbi:MAG: structural cement protein Gp24 [Candidatus Adiutrix sp.]